MGFTAKSSNSAHNSSTKSEIIVNTSDFNREDFKNYLSICETIQGNEKRRRSMPSKRSSNMLQATKTREELFECSTLDDDNFLKALEYQTTYVPKLDLSHALEETMKYFDEDVVVDSGSSRAQTPVKQSKVAAVLANFKNKTRNSPLKQTNRAQVEKVASRTQEFCRKHQLEEAANGGKPSTPKRLPKSMVAHIAKLFSANSTPVVAKIRAPSKPIYGTKLCASPVASPRAKRKQLGKTSCLVAENVFRQLTVKEKALLYNKYNEDVTKREAEARRNAALEESQACRHFACGEVVHEKQESVKHLTEKLEETFSQLNATQMGVLNKNSSVLSEKNVTRNEPELKDHVASIVRYDSEVRESVKTIAATEVSKTEKALSPQSKSTMACHALRASLESIEIKPKLTAVVAPLTTPSESNEELASIISTTSTSVSTDKPLQQVSAEGQAYDLFNMSQISSADSQSTHYDTNSFSLPEEFDYIKAIKRSRKKKMRRILTWIKDESIVEAQPVQTTDSDSESNATEAAKKLAFATLNIPKTLSNNGEEQVVISSPVDACNADNAEHPIVSSEEYQASEPAFDELDESLLMSMSLTENFNSRYTLTIISPPSQQLENEVCDSEIARAPVPAYEPRISRNPLALELAPTATVAQQSDAAAGVPNISQTKPNNVSRQLLESFDDQGFETGSNEMDLSISPTLKEHCKPVICSSSIKLSNDLAHTRNHSIEPSGFSTPMKGHAVEAAAGSNSQHFHFSPISIMNSESRRRSNSDSDSHHRSQAMEAINESNTQHENSLTPFSKNGSENVLSSDSLPNDVTTNTLDVTANATAAATNAADVGRTSLFWLNAGDFCISLEIYYITAERLRLLYDIFQQKSYEARELNFGIDSQTFFVSLAVNGLAARLPSTDNCSYYWFACGDLTMPFKGKHLITAKVKRLFSMINDAVAESGILRFGVDRYMFSNVFESLYCVPKVCLANSMTASMSSNGSKTSDLDHSVCVSDECDSGEFNRSYSPCYVASKDIAAGERTVSISFGSNALMSNKRYSQENEQEKLQAINEDTYTKQHSASEQISIMSKSFNNSSEQPEEQSFLNSVEQRMLGFAHPLNLTDWDAENHKHDADYVHKLQQIIRDINHIGQSTGYKQCSLQQLERFAYFLSSYADICVDSCLEHIDKILEVLIEKRGLQSNTTDVMITAL